MIQYAWMKPLFILKIKCLLSSPAHTLIVKYLANAKEQVVEECGERAK